MPMGKVTTSSYLTRVIYKKRENLSVRTQDYTGYNATSSHGINPHEGMKIS